MEDIQLAGREGKGVCLCVEDLQLSNSRMHRCVCLRTHIHLLVERVESVGVLFVGLASDFKYWEDDQSDSVGQG